MTSATLEQRLDHEQKLLALLIAESSDVSPFLTDILSATEDVDWDRFGALVERHRVGALVHTGFEQFSAMRPPTKLANMLTQKTSENAEAYMRAVKAANDLTDAFREAGIACTTLKGLGVAAAYYTSPSQREMIDIDLLVAPECYAQAEAIAIDQGFERYFPSGEFSDQRLETFMALHNAFAFIRKSDGAQLDLHWRMVQNPALMPAIDRSWRTAVTEYPVGGKSIPVLRPALHFVYVCLHGAKSGWVRLKWLADVDRFARGLSEQETLDAAQIFLEHDLQKIGAVSMGLACRILGTPIAPAFASLMQQDVARLVDVELEMIFSELPSRPHKLKEWRLYRDRFVHSLLLHSGGGYRRHALLRELARPRDLETVRLKPGNLWALGVISPALGIGRALKRLAQPK